MTPLQAEYRTRCLQEHDIQHQMPALYAWARHAKKVIELGVRGGNSLSAFLAAAEWSGGEVWSVDVADPQVPAGWRDLPFWHLLVADDISEEALAFCPDDADILFIDTSHYYPHTLHELQLYGPKVKPGGVILLHDTERREWPDVGWSLDEWCEATGNEWTQHPFWHGFGVVEIPVA